MPPKHLKRWIWEQKGWPSFHWDPAALSPALAKARHAQGEVAGMARLLDPHADLDAQLEVLTREGVATSAIEGEKLEPNSLRSSLARRLGLPTAGLPPASRSTEGLGDVLLDAATNYQQPLTLDKLCGWQAALFPTGRSGLHEIRTGQLRGDEPMQIVSGPIGRERVHYEAPPRARLEGEMAAFLAWFNDPPQHLDGVIRAGLAHAWFELIHPFEDGNGRVGRALLDRALAQDERRASRLYSMSARFDSVRDQYYDALGRLCTGSLDATGWLAWFLAQLESAAKSSEQTIEHVLFRARFWLQHARQTFNDRQKKALTAMLATGPDGFDGGMTNRKYAHLTKASPATAQRDLSQLAEWGCLLTKGAGRSVRYLLR
ncbi:MAG TPA: Fic family protein [Verrucomicrobiae bacterium]|nr:Fic family protein [Verrucomicrobiae bacterium]